MNAPSDKYKRRIVEMFDSFCKTVSRNYSWNLKRAKQNYDKHFIQEPVERLLELLGCEDEYPIVPYTFYGNGFPRGIWGCRIWLSRSVRWMGTIWDTPA